MTIFAPKSLSVNIVMKENRYKNIPIEQIEFNDGQVEGLAKNPRYIGEEEYSALKKSIEEAPEFLDARALLVYPHEGKFVTIGGNMRLKACTELGFKELPCYVFPEETPVEKLREYAIKDNVQQGKWDWQLLGEEWSVEELQSWGLECSFLGGSDDDTNIDDLFEEAPVAEKEKHLKIEIELPETMQDQLEEIKEVVKQSLEEYPEVVVK